MTDKLLWDLIEGEEPFIAVANHAGHELREDAASLMVLNESDRLREEDPFTDDWAAVAPTRLLFRRSRFEVDLNRSRETAVYLGPEDAWGLDIWRERPTADFVARSLEEYDAFYNELRGIYERKAARHPAFIVFDLHSYNHMRQGPDGLPADPAGNPEVNVGTGTMNRQRWTPVVDRFINDLRAFDYLGRHLDVRENVKFVGRQLPSWSHTHFPDQVCVLAIEVKKFFMDEWTGELDRRQHQALFDALRSTIPGLMETLGKIGSAS